MPAIKRGYSISSGSSSGVTWAEIPTPSWYDADPAKAGAVTIVGDNVKIEESSGEMWHGFREQSSAGIDIKAANGGAIPRYVKISGTASNALNSDWSKIAISLNSIDTGANTGNHAGFVWQYSGTLARWELCRETMDSGWWELVVDKDQDPASFEIIFDNGDASYDGMLQKMPGIRGFEISDCRLFLHAALFTNPGGYAEFSNLKVYTGS